MLDQYNRAQQIMNEAIKPYINNTISTKFRILGSDRNGNFRYTSNQVNAGQDEARTGDVNTMKGLGIRITGSSWVWLGVRYELSNGSASKPYGVFALDPTRWYAEFRQVANTYYRSDSGWYCRGTAYKYGVVPVLDLKPETKIGGGTGTFDDPWIIIDE